MTIAEGTKECFCRMNASVNRYTNEWKSENMKIVNFANEVQHFMLSRLVTWAIELMGTSMRSISSSQSWTGMAMKLESYHEELLTFFCLWFDGNLLGIVGIGYEAN